MRPTYDIPHGYIMVCACDSMSYAGFGYGKDRYVSTLFCVKKKLSYLVWDDSMVWMEPLLGVGLCQNNPSFSDGFICYGNRLGAGPGQPDN